jgi:hypothetical protein
MEDMLSEKSRRGPESGQPTRSSTGPYGKMDCLSLQTRPIKLLNVNAIQINVVPATPWRPLASLFGVMFAT